MGSLIHGNDWLCGKRPRANTWVRPYGAKDSEMSTQTVSSLPITNYALRIHSLHLSFPCRGAPVCAPGYGSAVVLSSRFWKGDDGVLSAGEQWSSHKTVVAVPFHNAAMAVISLSNVRFADWVKRHAAVTLPLGRIVWFKWRFATFLAENLQYMIDKLQQ